MYLKSLSARGFKSFADKTEILCQRGVIAVVGPNGSGKSNIADAVLWVLGEQSARHLRGGSMEDVIFAGSHSRPALGMAEVIMTLDNSSGQLPVEFTEVTIGRRLYRSGESEYLLMGKRCRLSDIIDLLEEAGLGRGIYSVISQGRIDEVLSGRPDERRALVDEAAGVLKHRKRKERAERKLDKVQQNLVRVTDIHSEVKKQIGPLKRQAESARVAIDLKKQLEELQVSLTVSDLKKYQADWDAAGKVISESKGKLTGTQKDLEGVSEQLGSLRHEAARLSESITERARLKETSIRSSEILKGMDRDIRTRFRMIHSQSQEIVSKLEDIKGSRDQTEQALQAAKTIRENEAARVETVSKALIESRDKLSQRRADLLKLQEVENARVRDLGRRAEELAKTRSNIELLGNRIAELTKVSDANRSTLDQTTKRAEVLDLRDIPNAQQALNQAGALVEQTGRDLKAGIEKAEKIQLRSDEGLRSENLLAEELAGLKAEGETVQGMLDHSRGAIGDDSAAKTIDDDFRGYISELLDVPEEVEGLVTQVLSDAGSGLLVEGSKAALRLIQSRDAISGDIVILADDMVSSVPSISLQSRSIRPLSDLVSTKNAESSALQYLLNTSFIADTVSEALLESSRHPDCRFITVDGVILGPGPTIRFSGSAPKEQSSIRLQRMVTEIEISSKEKSGKLKRMQDSRAGLAATKDEAQQDIASLREKLRLTIETQFDAKRAHESTLSGRSALETKTSELTETIRKDAVARDEADKRLAARLLELNTLEGRAGANGSHTESSPAEKISTIRNDVERLESEEVIFQKNIEDARESLSKADAEFQRAHADSSSRSQQVRELKAREERIKSLGGDLPVLTELINRSLAASEKVQDIASTQKVAAEQESVKNRAVIAQKEEARRILRSTSDTLSRKLHDAEVSQASLQAKVESSMAYLNEELEVPLEAAVQLPELSTPRDEARSQVRSFKARLSALGPVNPVAVEEYSALEERDQFLSEQLEDLSESRARVREVIEDLERHINDVFADTFEKASNHFSEIFSLLFPGGRGKLLLTNEDNTLDAGIDIEVKLERKKFQKLSLMSGGERALAALAFTFALYATKPTPFCILDEVDAPLDEVNLSRFVDLIDRFRKESQFFIITHQQRTMSCADVLYGVSMRANGTTALVSQKIPEQKLRPDRLVPEEVLVD